VLVSSVGDLADLCFLGAYVALTVALLRLVRARSRGRDVPALFDALVVTIGLGLVSWQFLMIPYARDPRSPRPTHRCWPSSRARHASATT
jgi:hypothetical protein